MQIAGARLIPRARRANAICQRLASARQGTDPHR
eukprot:CAMPEP_0198495192 /NCGR_PEP_ID=MMETSP1462-20131121/5060_1 /TAXON_ID=1333877 /ORGANISM="Brandtodinium nutriculum, Strain RCC3387" /LENGTH=33 /DNA_ID= /DNA_START= /DNA_END= /DNA_ORIENTATION=